MTKNVLFLSVFVLFINLSSTAQLTFKPGIKGGFNFSGFMGADAGEVSTVKAPHFGGIAQFSFGGDEDIISNALVVELVYSMQGAKSGTDKQSLGYINLPVMYQRYFGATGIFIESGLQPGFLISAKHTSEEGKIDIKEHMKKFDLAANFGLGYMHSSGIGINGRLSRGLLPVYPDGYDVRNVTISAGLFFIIGRE